jgi:hypothetical protein
LFIWKELSATYPCPHQLLVERDLGLWGGHFRKEGREGFDKVEKPYCSYRWVRLSLLGKGLKCGVGVLTAAHLELFCRKKAQEGVKECWEGAKSRGSKIARSRGGISMQGREVELRCSGSVLRIGGRLVRTKPRN